MKILKITLYLSLTLCLSSIATAKIVFVRYIHSGNEIFVMNDDGTNIAQITHNDVLESRPRWSPDGTKIAFFKDTNPTSAVRANTFIMNADGTNIRRLTYHDGNDRHLAFSPDGKKLVVSRAPTGDAETEGIHLIDIESGDTQHILNTETYGLDWSPDGKHIAFTNDYIGLSQSNIWYVNPDGTSPRHLVPPFQEEYTAKRKLPKWSPDGTQIMHTEIDLKTTIHHNADGAQSIGIRYTGTFRVQIFNIENGNVQKLNIPADWFTQSVSWMDGGKAVLFGSAEYRNAPPYDQVHQLYKYDIATSTITQLTHGTRNSIHGDWVSDNPSAITPVSPKGKLPTYWGELKKSW